MSPTTPSSNHDHERRRPAMLHNCRDRLFSAIATIGCRGAHAIRDERPSRPGRDRAFVRSVISEIHFEGSAHPPTPVTNEATDDLAVANVDLSAAVSE
jgi:hypothetical protein